MLTPTTSSTPSAGRKRTLGSGGRKIPTVANQKPNSLLDTKVVFSTLNERKKARKSIVPNKSTSNANDASNSRAQGVTKVLAPIWLDVPEKLEPNTWKPNWKKKTKGDPKSFFGDDDDKDNQMVESETVERACELSEGALSYYHKQWKAFKGMGNKRVDNDAMAEYVESRFVEWKWSSNAEHSMNLTYFGELGRESQKMAKSDKDKAIIKQYYSDLITAMKKERRYFRQQFEKEFLLTDPQMVTGVRFNRSTNKFTARCTYQHQQQDKQTNKVMWVKREDEFEVPEDWVLHEAGFAEDVLQHILDMDVEGGYFVVPKDRTFHEPETVTGIKFDNKRNVFVARVESQRVIREANNTKQVNKVPTQTKPNKVRLKTVKDEIKVTDDWVKDRAGMTLDAVKNAKNLDNDGFVSIPLDMKLKVHDRTIWRIKFVARQTRYILDVHKMRAEAPTLNLVMAGKRNATSQAFAASRLPTQQHKQKQVVSDAHWRVKFSDGNTLKLCETDPLVVENFSAKFLEELRRTKKGFVDIPVGDCKVSSLHRHPHLKVCGAPTIQFVQGNSEDLCVSNSLASAFHNLGFIDGARQIAQFGKTRVAGGAVNALEKVAIYAKEVLPSWIEMHRKKLVFNWRTELDKKNVFLAVLSASDGNCSHAITIHGGFIYDANETIAVPLCQEGLDYCTSTEDQPSTFIDFRRGYIFRYMGKQKKLRAKMTLVPAYCRTIKK